MEIQVSQLPSGGYGYDFSTISLSPLTFLEITKYLENLPDKSDNLSRYLYDIKMLTDQDPKIKDCYILDVDFLIFYLKLITVSSKLVYDISIPCPLCGENISRKIDFEKDIIFRQADPAVMNGSLINLGGNKYDTIVPTVKEFMKVFDKYLRFRKITDLKMIKTIALIKDFESNPNAVEDDVLGATHEDITLLMALRDLYYDRVEPVELHCKCERGRTNPEERRGVIVSLEELTIDFFRDLPHYSPIDGSKILFK